MIETGNDKDGETSGLLSTGQVLCPSGTEMYTAPGKMIWEEHQ